MSDTIPTPVDVAPKAPEAPATPEPAAAAPTADTPPWGDAANFDPERAWKLIQNKDADIAKLKAREALTPEQKQKIAEYDRLAEASKTDLERETDARTKAETRAQALLNRAIKAEVKALAAEGFADPSDASAFLDLTSYADESGDIDSDRIKADLADLLTKKPHLGKSPVSRVPAPNPAQGSSGAGAQTTPNIDAQIAEAEKAGNLGLAISLKRRKAYSAQANKA